MHRHHKRVKKKSCSLNIRRRAIITGLVILIRVRRGAASSARRDMQPHRARSFMAEQKGKKEIRVFLGGGCRLRARAPTGALTSSCSVGPAAADKANDDVAGEGARSGWLLSPFVFRVNRIGSRKKKLLTDSARVHGDGGKRPRLLSLSCAYTPSAGYVMWPPYARSKMGGNGGGREWVLATSAKACCCSGRAAGPSPHVSPRRRR